MKYSSDSVQGRERQMHLYCWTDKENFSAKKLFFALVVFEKAFDKVPREVSRWALRVMEVEEWLSDNSGHGCV
jgi:hypothetical protein